MAYNSSRSRTAPNPFVSVTACITPSPAVGPGRGEGVMQGKSMAMVSDVPAAAAAPLPERLPLHQAGRIVVVLSLVGWAAILTVLLPILV
jgi:hypothetical protein